MLKDLIVKIKEVVTLLEKAQANLDHIDRHSMIQEMEFGDLMSELRERQEFKQEGLSAVAEYFTSEAWASAMDTSDLIEEASGVYGFAKRCLENDYIDAEDIREYYSGFWFTDDTDELIEELVRYDYEADMLDKISDSEIKEYAEYNDLIKEMTPYEMKCELLSSGWRGSDDSSKPCSILSRTDCWWPTRSATIASVFSTTGSLLPGSRGREDEIALRRRPCRGFGDGGSSRGDSSDAAAAPR